MKLYIFSVLHILHYLWKITFALIKKKITSRTQLFCTGFNSSMYFFIVLIPITFLKEFFFKLTLTRRNEWKTFDSKFIILYLYMYKLVVFDRLMSREQQSQTAEYYMIFCFHYILFNKWKFEMYFKLTNRVFLNFLRSAIGIKCDFF